MRWCASGCRDGCVIADVDDRMELIEAAEWLGYALCHVEFSPINRKGRFQGKSEWEL
jgi:hypothetical protein